MITEQKLVVGKRFHQPVRRFPNTVVIMINRHCDDRPASDERLPGSFQSGKLRTFEVQLDEGRIHAKRIEFVVS